MSVPKEERKAITLVYTGMRENGDELVHSYSEVEKLPNDEHGERWQLKGTEPQLYKKRICYCMPGGVFAILRSKKNPDSVALGTDKYLGLWQDEDARVQWTAESRALENSWKEAKALKAKLTENAALARLEPFQDAYRKLKAEGRRQLLAEVIRYITGGRE